MGLSAPGSGGWLAGEASGLFTLLAKVVSFDKVRRFVSRMDQSVAAFFRGK